MGLFGLGHFASFLFFSLFLYFCLLYWFFVYTYWNSFIVFRWNVKGLGSPKSTSHLRMVSFKKIVKFSNQSLGVGFFHWQDYHFKLKGVKEGCRIHAKTRASSERIVRWKLIHMDYWWGLWMGIEAGALRNEHGD